MQPARHRPSSGRMDSDATTAFYVGTYTRARSRGIHLLRADLERGALVSEDLVAEIENPSFLALHPDGTHLYACLEKDDSEVAAFRIGDGGKLDMTDVRPTRGSVACHLCVDPAGKNVLVANYFGDDNIVSFPLRDGRLGEAAHGARHSGRGADPERQDGPHAHAVYTDQDGERVYAVDLGIDRVVVHHLDRRTGKLERDADAGGKVAPGSGPRHMAFHPTRPFAYVVNELANTVTVFRRDPESDALESIETLSTLPRDFEAESSAAEIAIHPSGRWLYVSNRGHDSLAAFRVDERSGRLTLLRHVSSGGRGPRHFAFSPDGRYVLAANEKDHRIAIFRVTDQGELEPTGSSFEVPDPVCVLFAPASARMHA
jgi:6-phosphogluconolactonase